MTDPTDPMMELRARLAGGVLGTVRENRSQSRQANDYRKFGEYLTAERLPGRLAELMPAHAETVPKLSSLLEGLESFGGPEHETVVALIDALAALLGHHRPLLLGVLFSPHLLLDRLPEVIGKRTDTEKRWAVLCWIAEAAWECVQSRISGADRQMLTPLAARLRFLVLSEPMRHRADAASPWLSSCTLGGQDGRNPYGVYCSVFGKDTWFSLLNRCREARWNWQAQLDAHQSAPLLAQAKPSEIEEELGLLIFRTGRAGAPLVLSPKPLAESAPVSADDRAVIAEVVERHLLPRFQLVRVAALVTASPVRFPKVPVRFRKALAHFPKMPARFRKVRVALLLPPALAALPLVPASAALVLAGSGHFTAAAQTALGCYALIGLVTLLGGARVAAPWLLRIPAASALGMLVLVALHPTWWNAPKGGWGTPAALLALSFGYLVIEVHNHGVAAVRAVLRAFVVTVIGALHAILVALIGLVLIAPAYAERPDNGPRIADWFASGDIGRSWHLLILAAACCLTAGVFSQILWEDRPITASLAHVGWRSGR